MLLSRPTRLKSVDEATKTASFTLTLSHSLFLSEGSREQEIRGRSTAQEFKKLYRASSTCNSYRIQNVNLQATPQIICIFNKYVCLTETVICNSTITT